ncbi:MAG: DNA recombination protein RmuC [bacterium]|nr:DNA recombination protein RmuC [bacterium]
MQNELLIIAIIVIGFVGIFYFINKKLSELKENKDNDVLIEIFKDLGKKQESLEKSLNDVLRTTNTDMVRTLQENSKQLNERLDKSASVIRDVGKEVGQMSEIGRSMKELQEFLKSPKLRGNIGEQVLKDLISQMFPKNSFHLQYTFKSGEKVDAAIKTDAGILPIDSKFPMENFTRMAKAENKEQKETVEKEFIRDVKKHIDAISKKYILPEEGTMDFALMYVPSESVYYELVNITEVLDYARKSRVYVVSPSTLYAHLQTILLSFEGKKIESRSRDIFKMLRAIQIDYNKVDDTLSVLGKHINNASSQFSNVTTGFIQLGKKLRSTQTLESSETKELED